MKKLICPLFFLLVSFIFFWQFFLKGLMPIPADTIVGLYHPWRDFYVQDYPNGIPFKNFLITDPVRQQYVWRSLAIEQIKKRQLPLWNSYNFSGNPLLANFQTAAFYPLNFFFFLFSFNIAWSALVMLQPLLAGIFLYLYLRNLKLNQWASLIGGISFAFSGFSIAWLEWNTVGHVAMWLPLILLSIDKILYHPEVLSKDPIRHPELVSGFVGDFPPKAGSRFGGRSHRIMWGLIFLFSLCSSFLAGHLQVFLYVFIFSLIYFLIRWRTQRGNKKILIIFTFYFLLFTLITAVQWLPTLQFINFSARNFDLPNWQTSSWFLPWQNLVQFIVPDFFGNPATLNYWGEWNYGEFIGYMGILPLLFALLAILWRRDRKTWLATFAVLLSLTFMLPTPLAKFPYQLSIPFLSTLQPTRLMVIVDFCLAILSALGVDYFIKCLHDTYKQSFSSNQVSKIIKTLFAMGTIFIGIWLYVFFGQGLWVKVSSENLEIARRNLLLPTILFFIFVIALLIYDILIYHIRNKNFLFWIRKTILIGIMGLVVFDLFRFGWKFTPFTDTKFLFPQTKTIKFLQNQPKPFRIMTTDNRILPPNLSIFYHLEDISGYDPLYLKNYGELIAAWYRNKPDISPFSFNRILTPQDYPSKIADLLNVKYVLSLKDEVSPKLTLVFQEGQTRVYENKNVLPRVFFVENIKCVKDGQEAIKEIFKKSFDPIKTAIVENCGNMEKGKFLVISEVFYPTQKIKNHRVYKTDFTLMGIFLLPGEKYENLNSYSQF